MNIEEEVKKLIGDNERGKAIQVLEAYPEIQNSEMLLLQLGELLFAESKMTEALNKFNAVIRINPENRKAINYVTMIRGIMDYYNKDLLNP